MNIKFHNDKYIVEFRDKKILAKTHLDAIQDAYWAFEFQNANSVSIRRINGDVIDHFDSIEDWKRKWTLKYGEKTGYYVERDRH